MTIFKWLGRTRNIAFAVVFNAQKFIHVMDMYEMLIPQRFTTIDVVVVITCNVESRNNELIVNAMYGHEKLDVLKIVIRSP